MVEGHLFVQTLLSGLAAGGVYALVALGFGLAYRTTRVFNFAQGAFGALGAYITFSLFVGWGVPFWGAAAIASLAVAAVAVLAERLALRPLYKRGELYTFISTIGLGFAIESAILLIWGPVPRTMPSVLGNTPWVLFGFRFVPELVWNIAISLGLAALTYLFLKKTRAGIAMRACAQDRDVAALLGIRVNRVYSVAFALSGIMGAVAGILISPTIFIRPTMGASLGLPGFVAALVGGLGSIQGAVVGGFALGLGQAISVFVVPPRYRDVAFYVILAIVILVKPSGIFGEESIRVRDA